MSVSKQEYERQEQRILKIFDEARANTIRLIKNNPKNVMKNITYNPEKWISDLRHTSVEILNRKKREILATTFSSDNPLTFPEVVFYNSSFEKTDEDLYQISLHEIAHVLTPNYGHSYVWQTVLTAIGFTRPPVKYLVKAGKHYTYKIPVRTNAVTGRTTYRTMILDQKYKNEHPENDKYIVEEHDFT